MRIESVRCDASGNATVVVTGGISFFMSLRRVCELPLPWAEPLREDQDALSREDPALARIVLERLARGDFEFDGEDQLLAALKWVDEEERARRRAILLCARAEQSSSGLAAKLMSKGFSRRAALAAIESLKTEKIVDDARYARIWARGRAERRTAGPALLAAELRSRGQGEDAVRGALESIDFDRVLARAAIKEIARLDRSRHEKPKAGSLRFGFYGQKRTESEGASLDDNFAGGEIPESADIPKRDGRFWDELYHVLKGQGFDGDKIREEIDNLKQK